LGEAAAFYPLGEYGEQIGAGGRGLGAGGFVLRKRLGFNRLGYFFQGGQRW